MRPIWRQQGFSQRAYYGACAASVSTLFASMQLRAALLGLWSLLTLAHVPFASAAAASGRLVFAHYMVGYTYQYSQSDWARDIALASSAGIDAFACNVFVRPRPLSSDAHSGLPTGRRRT